MKPPFPADAAPSPWSPLQPANFRMQWLGLFVFLTSLSVFFLAGMLGFLVIRFTSPNFPARGWLRLPWGLWVSTLVLLGADWAIRRANISAAAKDLAGLPSRLRLAFALSVLFVVVQVPSLWILLQRHTQAAAQSIGLYGLVSTLIVIHAAHVIGGLVPLGRIEWKLWQGRFGLADLPNVGACAIYWRFLEVIWLLMFGAFLITG